MAWCNPERASSQRRPSGPNCGVVQRYDILASVHQERKSTPRRVVLGTTTPQDTTARICSTNSAIGKSLENWVEVTWSARTAA